MCFSKLISQQDILGQERTEWNKTKMQKLRWSFLRKQLTCFRLQMFLQKVSFYILNTPLGKATFLFKCRIARFKKKQKKQDAIKLGKTS